MKIYGIPLLVSLLAFSSLFTGLGSPISAQSSLSVTTSKNAYSIGESVQITLTYEGIPTTRTFGSPCISSFDVIDGSGRQVFTWFVFCITVVVTEMLSTGKVVGSFTWNQTDISGNQVPSGIYTIRGFLSQTPIPPVLGSTQITIRSSHSLLGMHRDHHHCDSMFRRSCPIIHRESDESKQDD